ncbi:UNVERIFIED_CONTAM: putative serine/threonine-protein kinase PIX13 [Sesamum calycinum]|uniref:Serine/threonine-protein kinase PIX13 n=1 Tax=Sesamum calycinum TaxID=2727403 RepID=A0AAW2SUN7_9LAMI
MGIALDLNLLLTRNLAPLILVPLPNNPLQKFRIALLGFVNCSGGGLSATSSSAGLSRFSAALSDDAYLAGEILPTPNLKIYSFSDLRNATRSFKSDMVLGVGGFGTVYMDFAHPNLVRLLGYCWEDKELLLVYEFMQKGSLENHLFRRNAAVEPLSWDLRLKIAIGEQRGAWPCTLQTSKSFTGTLKPPIFFLMEFRVANVTHFLVMQGLPLGLSMVEMKASCITFSYNAKISDFGLAKLGPSGGDSHVTTRVMGTYGYAAPEYVATGHLYVKSDVYGFGVVLLEMLTGMRALDTRRPSGQHNLVDWLKPLLSQRRKLKYYMDARIEGQYSSKAALQASQLTLRCLEGEPRKRPSMKEVVDVLEQIAAMEKPKESKNRSTHSSSQHNGQSPRPYRSPRHPSKHGTPTGAGR